jgi:hypothetical protein
MSNKTIFVIIVLILLIGVGVYFGVGDRTREAVDDPTIISSLHRFEDFPVTDSYTGPVAGVDFAGQPGAAEFRTALTEGMAEGVRFAGRYAVAEWGCGTSCQSYALIDAETGEIVEFGIISAYGAEYRPDSRLFIVNPPSQLADLETTPEVVTDYHELVDGELRVIAKQTPGEGEALMCAQVITTARNPLTGQEAEFPSPCAVPFGWQVASI